MSSPATAPLASNPPRPVFPVEPTRTLIDDFLEQQQRLQTPVARFSAAHDSDVAPAAHQRYRDLLPLSAPRPGEQYAFEVDLDSCTGCKACVAGCHSLNGLDEGETWRDIGALFGGTADHPFQQTVTTACHHCADPACLNGCPVLAYEKDPLTGIVRHLDDQCIGCQYCVLKCPYDVPKYNERLGIVRKCDLCYNRLSAGEAPACVQACPTEAIRIVTVTTAEVVRDTVGGRPFLPTAPSPDYTFPTTRYLSQRELPDNIAAADASALKPQPTHWPLVFMLALTQFGLGLSIAARIGPLRENRTQAGWTGLALFGLGLVASVVHLGQPLRAWRIFLNLRRSWLSREAVVFGISLPLAMVTTLMERSAMAWGATWAGLGLLGVFCSAMIYIDTRRAYWRSGETMVKFFGTVLLGATVLTAPAAAIAVLAAKLAWECRAYRFADRNAVTARAQTARLLAGSLRKTSGVRFGSAALAGLFLVCGFPWLALLPLLIGELAERSLFFQAVVAPKMPGVASS